MFSIPLPERLPSIWRLALMQTIFVAASIALCLTFAGIALHRDLEVVARGGMLDDLGEYAFAYEEVGLEGVEALFYSGHHNAWEGVRVTRPDSSLIKQIGTKNTVFSWPDEALLRRQTEVRGVSSVEHPERMPQMLIGRRVLHDGNVLWCGRLNAVDQGFISHIRQYLWMAGAAAAIIAMVPLFWFGGQVMHPVREMIASAEALAKGAGEERLRASSAVHELQDFARVFNTVLDRNHALTEELQAANDQLAHELRTPLARIRGNLEIMLDTAENAATHDAADHAMEEIDRASTLIQSILTVRAGDNGALKLLCEPISIRGLLGELIELYVVAAEDKNLSLILEDGEDATLSIDSQLVTQALANLLDNALHYTPAGGKVTAAIALEVGECVVSVNDDGPGLQPQELETIWERFRRGSASSARTPGMGLGLSLVRAIAMAHGGTAGCGNRPGGGSVFWMRFPMPGKGD